MYSNIHSVIRFFFLLSFSSESTNMMLAGRTSTIMSSTVLDMCWYYLSNFIYLGIWETMWEWCHALIILFVQNTWTHAYQFQYYAQACASKLLSSLLLARRFVWRSTVSRMLQKLPRLWTWTRTPQPYICTFKSYNTLPMYAAYACVCTIWLCCWLCSG